MEKIANFVQISRSRTDDPIFSIGIRCFGGSLTRAFIHKILQHSAQVRPTYSGLSFNRGWIVRVAYLGSFPFTGSFPVVYEASVAWIIYPSPFWLVEFIFSNYNITIKSRFMLHERSRRLSRDSFVRTTVFDRCIIYKCTLINNFNFWIFYRESNDANSDRTFYFTSVSTFTIIKTQSVYT